MSEGEGQHVADGPDLIRADVRTWAYVVGLFAGSFAVVAPEPWARYLAALSAASNAVALGYRPTR